MKNPAEFALGRPRVVLLATLLLVIYGVLSWIGLPRRENPTLQNRNAAINVYLPGAAPEKVERLINRVLEDQIAQVDDIDEIFSNAFEGGAFLLVGVKRGAPAARRLAEIEDKVREARALLPAGASEPEVDLRSLRTNTMVLAVTGSLPPLALRDQAEELERALEALPDVARAELVGAPREQITVDLDLRLLAARGLPLTHVISALEARNVTLPAGELELGGVRSSIQATGAFATAEELADTYLGASPEGNAVVLRDVARVEHRLDDEAPRARFRHEPAVAVAVEMLPRRNAVALGERVRTLLAERAPGLPEGMRVEIVADEPLYVGERIDRLTNSLFAGMALVALFSFIGMGLRSGLIVSLSIPLSLVVAMGLISLAGLELHQISVAALAIAIGLVVDEAIIVVDNVHRHLELGASPREAAIQGLGEIHMAIVAGAATTIAAFVPLMLLEGDIGDFIRSIPIAATMMLLASVTIAHFFTPLAAAWLHSLRPRAQRSWAVTRRLVARYERTLRVVLRHPVGIMAAFTVLFGVSIQAMFVFLWPIAGFPPADRHQFLIRARTFEGTPIARTDALVAEIEAILADDPDVRSWASFIGEGAPKFYYNEFTEERGETVGQLVVHTRRDIPFDSTTEVAARINRELRARIPGAWILARELRQGYGGGSDIEVFVTGDNLEVLRDLGVAIKDIAEQIPHVREVRESFGFDPLTLQASVDPARANLLGISHTDVATTLRAALDGVVATTLQDEEDEIDVVVRVAREQRSDVGDLATLPFHSPTTGQIVPLSQVASLEPSFTTRQIMRWNRKREVAVNVSVDDSREIVAVSSEIQRRVGAEVDLPGGYEISYWGQAREATEQFLSLARAAIVAIFLIYIILVARFRSLTQPMLIVLAIPMAMIGAIWGLSVTGNALGFMSFLGMISLTGIVVNDSIILLDYVNTLRRRGAWLEEAVVEGARARLRPVILTSVTTIGGLLPLALFGGSFWAGFGFTMIFGLAASTLLTLLVQPAIYLALERRRSRDFGPEAEPATPPALPAHSGLAG